MALNHLLALITIMFYQGALFPVCNFRRRSSEPRYAFVDKLLIPYGDERNPGDTGLAIGTIYYYLDLGTGM